MATTKDLYTAEARQAGQVPANHPAQYAISQAAEDSADFGMALMAGTDTAKQVKKYAGAGGVFRGVAAWSKDGSKVDGDDLIVGYESGDPVGVVQKGLVVVEVTEAVNVDDPVRIVHTGGDTGKFATSASAGNTTLLSGVNFKGSTSGAGKVTLELLGPAAFDTTDDT